MSNQKKRIGIIGGTFDPIHYGHIYIARQAQKQYALDILVWTVSRNSYYKSHHKVTDYVHRYNMLVLALENSPQSWLIDEYESDQVSSKPTYTLDTVNRLKNKFHIDTDFFWIMGQDSWGDLKNWYRAEKLAEEVSFIVFPRLPLLGVSDQHFLKFPPKWLVGEVYDLSSSELREYLSGQQRDTIFLEYIDQKVKNYIDINHLYMDDKK